MPRLVEVLPALKTGLIRFLCAGVVAETLGIHRVSQMGGVGRRLPLTMAAFTLAAFGMMYQTTNEPLIKQITQYIMADEARHVAFGVMSLRDVYPDMTDAERKDREEFTIDACYLMRDRFDAAEVYEGTSSQCEIGACPRFLAGRRDTTCTIPIPPPPCWRR